METDRSSRIHRLDLCDVVCGKLDIAGRSGLLAVRTRAEDLARSQLRQGGFRIGTSAHRVGSTTRAARSARGQKGIDGAGARDQEQPCAAGLQRLATSEDPAIETILVEHALPPHNNVA